MGIYVFSREVLLDLLQNTTVTDFGREIIPAALKTHRVRAYLHDGYWADVGTVESFYDANILLTEPHAPFNFYDPRRPIYTHERFLPPSHLRSCTVRESIVAEGCFLDECSIEQSVIGIRTHVSQGHPHHAVGAPRRRHVRTPTHRGSSASAATSCSIASSSTRTPPSATARACQRGQGCSTPTATATTSAAASSSCPRAAGLRRVLSFN